MNAPFARAHFALGYTLHEQGRSAEAIAALKTCLSIDPAVVDAQYVLATLYLEEGRLAESIRLFESVLEIDPANAFAAGDLCVAYVRSGDLGRAEAAVKRGLDANQDVARLHHLLGNLKLSRHYANDAVLSFQRALSLDSTLAEAHHNCGLALQTLGRLPEALAAQDSALALRPGYSAAFLARARLLNGLGRRLEAEACFEESLASFQQAQSSAPAAAEVQFDMAAVLFELKRPTEALARLDEALLLKPDYIDAHRDRAMVLDALGRNEESLVSLENFLALRLDPHQSLLAAGELLKRLGRVQRALELYEAAIEADPDHPDAIGNYGAMLQYANRHEEALAAYDRALQADVGLPEVLSNRGLALTELGRHREALASYEEALSIRPSFENVHYNEGLCRLSLGDLEGGWSKYEWRWKSRSWLDSQSFYGQRTFDKERWRGDESLKGKAILLHPEQGLGDTIQFSRYAQVLSSMGATVILEVQPALKQLLRDLPGADRLLAVGETLPPHDLQCPLMSLPLACGTTLDTIPAADGYLGLSPEHRARVERWRVRLGPRTLPRVGIVWSGSTTHKNDVNRSIPFVGFSKIISDRQQFICLQNELRDTDRASLAERPRIQVLCDELGDFAETAALIANLDLVVCVDTSVAHVAGALGKAVWVLLPANPDWRWLLERRDSPWYSSMRLFRQPALGDWDTVLEAVRSELNLFF